MTENYKISPGPDIGLSTDEASMSESVEVSDDPAGCWSDRKTALSEGLNLYLPECTTDGRFQKVRDYFRFFYILLSSFIQVIKSLTTENVVNYCFHKTNKSVIWHFLKKDQPYNALKCLNKYLKNLIIWYFIFGKKIPLTFMDAQ